jgi:hypothetical protein
MSRLKVLVGLRGMAAFVVLSGLVLPGCPLSVQSAYDLGYAAGFAVDDEYWDGFFDSFDTINFGPIYYRGSDIPLVDTPPYDAGYYDGLWVAYNDGYFVSYDYAFTIGFSEGYDVGYGALWALLLVNDAHIEHLDGGFSDGYHDGFSEGRVFGAWEYLEGWSFDWLSAMLDYRDGIDVTVGLVNTGAEGPVVLYEYGTDPLDYLKSARLRVVSHAIPAIRKRNSSKEALGASSYRTLSAEARVEFEGVSPVQALRGNYSLSLEDSWLDRIEDYLGAMQVAEE